MVELEVQGWQLEIDEVKVDQIIDLRTSDRFGRGHMPGAINVPYTRFQIDILSLLQQGSVVLVVDAGGARAAEMAVWLRARGFSACYLAGGMVGWMGERERV